MRFPLLAAVALLAAGCLGAVEPEPTVPVADPAQGVFRLDSGLLLHAYARQSNLSLLHLAEGAGATVTFPAGVLVLGEDGRLLPATEPVALAAAGTVQFLPPYGATNLTVEVTAEGGATETLALALDATSGALYPGELAVELLKVQRDQFPHRSPGNPSYEASMAYFAEFFQSLGYEVVVETYPHLAQLPEGPARAISPASLNNVVAYKRGSLTPERYLVFGGHFDVVENTRDGAFDNTAGTVATMVMAKAFANITTERTLVFGLWGGEEDGILGSQAWISRHSDLVPFIDGYFNYDVTGLVWPAPKVEPSRIVVATGPDGPVADALHGYAATVLDTYMQVGAAFVMEGVAQGQAQGAGVNAQSDHTPFMARGVPVFFTFTERVQDVFAIIHSDLDTVDNLTKYALTGIEGMANDAPLTPEEIAEGEWYLARSFEVQLALGFYWAALADAGVFPDPRTDGAPGAAALAARLPTPV